MEINSSFPIVVYTTSDFPDGKAPENFVREFMLGIKHWNMAGHIYRLRGRTYLSENKTGVSASNYIVKKYPRNEILKVFILAISILYIPFNLLFIKLWYRTRYIVLYGIEYSYFILPICFFSKLLKIKIYRIITDSYRSSSIAPVWWKRPKLYFYKFQKKYFDRYLNGIICLSTTLREESIKNGIKAERILVVPHFINIKSFNSVVTSKQNESKIKRIGFCGTPHEPNGIFDLINAFKVIKSNGYNSELFIIGEPFLADKERIYSALKSFTSDFVITGYKTKDDVVDLLNSCDILVNPRKSGVFAESGFPTKLGEYFATKKPVVSTRVGDIRLYFTNQKELMLVEPDDVDGLAKSIIFLLNNLNIASKIGHAGYSWARQNLDYIANAHRVINFIIK